MLMRFKFFLAVIWILQLEFLLAGLANDYNICKKNTHNARSIIQYIEIIQYQRL